MTKITNDKRLEIDLRAVIVFMTTDLATWQFLQKCFELKKTKEATMLSKAITTELARAGDADHLQLAEGVPVGIPLELLATLCTEAKEQEFTLSPPMLEMAALFSVLEKYA